MAATEEMLMIEPDCCLRMIGMHVLAGHDGAAQVDGVDAVEGLLGDLGGRGVAAGQADADVVVQDVDAAPQLHGLVDRGLQRGLFRHVGLEGDARAALFRHQRGSLLRRLQPVIHGQHLGALAREQQRRGAAVAHGLARGLPGADDDRSLAFQSHCFLRFLLLSPWKTGGDGITSRVSRSARRPPTRPCRARARARD